MATAHKEEHDPSKRIKLRMPAKGLVNYRRLKEILISLAREMKYKLSIDGAEFSTTTADGEMHFKITGGGGAGDHPWKCKVVDGALYMMGGSYNEVALGGGSLGSGTGWAYIRAQWDLTEESGYVISSSLLGASIEVDSAVPASDYGPTTAIIYIPLVQFANNKVLSQARTDHVNGTVCDDLSGEGTVHHSS